MDLFCLEFILCLFSIVENVSRVQLLKIKHFFVFNFYSNIICLVFVFTILRHIHGRETKSVTAIICVHVTGKFDSSA